MSWLSTSSLQSVVTRCGCRTGASGTLPTALQLRMTLEFDADYLRVASPQLDELDTGEVVILQISSPLNELRDGSKSFSEWREPPTHFFEAHVSQKL